MSIGAKDFPGFRHFFSIKSSYFLNMYMVSRDIFPCSRLSLLYFWVLSRSWVLKILRRRMLFWVKCILSPWFIFWVKTKARTKGAGAVILVDSLTQHQTIEVGRENATSRQKDLGSITSDCLSQKIPWRQDEFYPEWDFLTRKHAF
jgi:hypothetical protein